MNSRKKIGREGVNTSTKSYRNINEMNKAFRKKGVFNDDNSFETCSQLKT